MNIPQPYFMNNSSWYYFDENDWKYILTDDAPEEAKKSYDEFYSQLETKHLIEK